MNPEPFKAFWSTWAHVPLSRAQLEAALKWLIQRRYGVSLAWIPFNKWRLSDPSAIVPLKLNRQKQVWVLFTSSTDEVAGDPLMQGNYESQSAWVRDVVQWVKLRDDVELVIKIHPNLGNDYIGKAVSELRIYEGMNATLPANVRIVLPEDSVSAYALAGEIDVGLTFGSTIGLEMAMMGKRYCWHPELSTSMVHTSSSFYPPRKHCLKMSERCLHAMVDREIQREAF